MQITIPYKFQPRTYQVPLLRALDSGIRRAVIVWHRRSGKDKVCWNYMIKRAIQEIGTYYYFLPEYSQAKKVIWDNIDNDGFKMTDHIPKGLIRKKNDTELKIELINGSVIQLIGADVFEKSGVGANIKGCVFSEYSITKPTAWDYVRPILAASGGWAVFNFTPRGVNHAHKLLMQAKEEESWFWEILGVEDTQVISKEVLEQERKEMPQDLYEQEYLCKFIEGAAQFFKRVRENVWSGDLTPEASKFYQIGVDLAKYHDWTVITVVDLSNFRVGKQERFNQIDYNLQKSKIEAVYYKWNQGRVILDSTGVGEPIYDDLQTRISVEPFRFTEETRYKLLNNTRILLEQDKIKIPDDSGLIDELTSMQYVLGPTGKVKIAVPEGLHDDRIMSLSLALWGLKEPIREKKRGEVDDWAIYKTY